MTDPQDGAPGGDDRLYTIREAAVLTRRTTKAIRGRVDRGALPVAAKNEDGERLIAHSALVAAGLLSPGGAPAERVSVSGDVVDMLAQRAEYQPVQQVEARLDVNGLMDRMLAVHAEDVARVRELERMAGEHRAMSARMEAAEVALEAARQDRDRLEGELAEVRRRAADLEGRAEAAERERDALREELAKAAVPKRRWWQGAGA